MEIIVTVGPGSLDKITLGKLLESGATSFRINLSHSTHESLEYYYQFLLDAGISPCLDTQGCQIRTAGNTGEIFLCKGTFVHLTTEYQASPKEYNTIYLNGCDLEHISKTGAFIRIDFDGIVLKVISSSSRHITCVVLSSGYAKSNKAVDIIGSPMTASSLTSFDTFALKRYRNSPLKAVYVSFAGNASVISKTRNLVLDSTKIIAKVETIQGMKKLDEICNAADAVLIDRGDLSREVSISLLPMAVRSIVAKCKANKTPVYVATSILDSLISGSIPSKSEISDLWSLFSLGIDGIVLAAEVAVGKRPVESVFIVKRLHDIYMSRNDADPDVIADMALDMMIQRECDFGESEASFSYWFRSPK